MVWKVSINILYDILYSTAGITLYSVIIFTGYRKSYKEHKKVVEFLKNLKEVLKEIKSVISKEEAAMLDKEPHKNSRSSEYLEEVEHRLFGHKKEFVNTLSLTDLLTKTATDEDYDKLIGMLTKLARETYAQYKFQIFKSSDETTTPNLIQIVSAASEAPELHKEIFATAMNCGIDYSELVKRFAAHVAAGNVIDIGDDVVVITNDGTHVAPTGVSQINSGLEGSDITFIISFIKKENLEAFNAKNLKNQMEQSDTPVEAPQTPEQGTTNAWKQSDTLGKS